MLPCAQNLSSIDLLWMKKVIRYFSDAVNFMTSGVSFRFRCPQLPVPWLVGYLWYVSRAKYRFGLLVIRIWCRELFFYTYSDISYKTTSDVMVNAPELFEVFWPLGALWNISEFSLVMPRVSSCWQKACTIPHFIPFLTKKLHLSTMGLSLFHDFLITRASFLEYCWIIVDKHLHDFFLAFRLFNYRCCLILRWRLLTRLWGSYPPSRYLG